MSMQTASELKLIALPVDPAPLTDLEKAELVAAETRIDHMIDDIEATKMDVAKELKVIHDNGWYRGTHKTFADYVEARFGRCRDWAYKTLDELEVRLGFDGVDANVESIIQTATVREVAALSKLKKHKEKMREALVAADATAKAANRPRTVQDVQKAVAFYKPVKKAKGNAKRKAKPAKPVRTARVKGLDFAGGKVEDLPRWFASLAKWLRENRPEGEFSIKVGKAPVPATV